MCRRVTYLTDDCSSTAVSECIYFLARYGCCLVVARSSAADSSSAR